MQNTRLWLVTRLKMRLWCAKHLVAAGHEIQNEAGVCKMLGHGRSQD